MATAPNPQVNLQQVLDQIAALQGQLVALKAENQTLTNQIQGLQQANAPQPGAAPAGGAARVCTQAPAAFALMPATTDLTGLLDYSSKLGQSIYKQGCEKLMEDKGFAMTPAMTVAFVKAFENRCTIMGWNKGGQNITQFANAQGVIVDLVKNYGQIDEATLHTTCEDFCGVGGSQSNQRAAQNNHMMAQCIKKSLTVAALARLEPYQAQYLFNGVEYSPLLYKVIMHLATIDSIATTKVLRANLNNLPIYAALVNGDINLINSYFDTNYMQILARGSTMDDPIAKLFDAYLVVPDYNFKQYIMKKQDDYHDGNLGANFTHKSLMAQATAKFTYLTTRKIWGSKSPDEERLITMIADLKGNLKLAPALADKRKQTTRRATSIRATPRSRTRRTRQTRLTRRRRKLGASSLPRMAIQPPRKWLERSTSGASTTWLGALILPRSAALAQLARKLRSRRTRSPRPRRPFRTPPPRQPSQIPPSLPSSLNSPTTKNDGVTWHVYGGHS
jgi:hypothetical protein